MGLSKDPLKTDRSLLVHVFQNYNTGSRPFLGNRLEYTGGRKSGTGDEVLLSLGEI